VVTSKQQTVTLQGTGGIGKTVLASALAHDCDVRRTFPDGVFWVEIGREPSISLRQGEIGVAMGDARDEYPDEARGKSRLGALLANRAVLIILDDVWKHPHAEAFRVAGSRCRIVITTRDYRLVTQLGAVNRPLDVLGEAEGLALIAGQLGLDVNAVYAHKE